MRASSAILGVLIPHPWTQSEAPGNDLNRRARVLPDLLTGTADRLAHEAGCVKRQPKLTGSNFAQALVVSFLGDSQASPSRIQCTAAAVGLQAARPSLEERSTPQDADFLTRWLAAATAPRAETSVVLALRDRFTAVEVLDRSRVALPAELAAVYRGAQSGTTPGDQAAVKRTVGLDLRTGAWRGPERADGRAADLAAARAQADPPRGRLPLADLNSFSLEKFARWGDAGADGRSRRKLPTVVQVERGSWIDLLKTCGPPAGGTGTWTGGGVPRIAGAVA